MGIAESKNGKVEEGKYSNNCQTRKKKLLKATDSYDLHSEVI